MKLQKRELKIDYDGEVYNLKFPNVKQIMEMQNADEKDYEATFMLLDNLGLPREISEEMEINHIVQIMNALTDIEKK